MRKWNGKMKAVTFSYDDGVFQDKKLVELFNYYNLKCTFNLNTGIQNTESCWEDKGVLISRMPQEGLSELYKGHEIASHALTHPALTDMDIGCAETEMKDDMENIQRLYGSMPVGMAYPYGAYNDDVVLMLKKLGVGYARTVESSHSFQPQQDLLRFKPTCHHNDEMLFSLADEFLSMPASTPQIFYIWGHSYEFDVNNNWDRIEKLCEIISGKEDIFYGANKDVLLK